MTRTIVWASATLAMTISLGLLAGCQTHATPQAQAPSTPEIPTMVALHADTVVDVDGRLDEEIWQQAPAYPLVRSADAGDRGVDEPGEVRLAWDDEYLYLAARMTDTDVVAESDENDVHHYQFGDVCELFVKPADATYYWELYVTPNGKKTDFFFPGRGRIGLPSCIEADTGLTVGAQLKGTLNIWHDRDGQWTAELAIPVEDLTSQGATFAPGSEWRVLVGRYNFSRYLGDGPELTMAPQLPFTGFHHLPGWAKLVLRK